MGEGLGAQVTPRGTVGREWVLTGDLGGEGAAGDVLVIEAHDDAVVSGRRGQVGYGACPVLVVLACDLRLGWALHGQRQSPCATGHVTGAGTPPTPSRLPPSLPSARSQPPVLPTFARILGDDGKGGRLVDHAVAQARPVGADVPGVDGVHVELQGAP